MMNRVVRSARLSDMADIMLVVDAGRRIMRGTGNVHQWVDGYPSESVVLRDIEMGVGFVVEDDGRVVGYFALLPSPEPSYGRIYGGRWLDDERGYHVVHRMSSYADVHGVFGVVMDFCFGRDSNIRIDTHRDNLIMRHLLEKYGFVYCGVIYLANGDERLAYQKVVREGAAEEGGQQEEGPDGNPSGTVAGGEPVGHGGQGGKKGMWYCEGGFMLKCFFIMNKMFYRFLLQVVVVMVAVCAHGQNGLVMISIETSGALSAEKKVAGRMRMDGYDGGIGIKLRGNSSLGFAQKKYTIELRSDDGGKLAAGLLGMPAHSDWVLLAPYNDVSAVRDALAFQLWRDMGHWAPHTRLVELTLDGEYRPSSGAGIGWILRRWERVTGVAVS